MNAAGEDGWRPLHTVALRNDTDFAKLLISAGADVHAKILSGDRKGMTPLDIARNFNKNDVAIILEDAMKSKAN